MSHPDSTPSQYRHDIYRACPERSSHSVAFCLGGPPSDSCEVWSVRPSGRIRAVPRDGEPVARRTADVRRRIPLFGAPRITESVNFNPPQFHLLVLPFAHLELWPGLLLWQAAASLAGRVAAAIVVRTLRLGWSPLRPCSRRRPAQQRCAVEYVVVRADFALPAPSGHAGLASVAAWTLTVGRLDRGRGEHQTVPPIVVPYLLLTRQWRAASGAAAHGRRASRSALLSSARLRCAVVRGGTLADLAGTFPQRVFPGYVARRDAGVAGRRSPLGSAIGVAATVWLARKRDADAAWALLMAGALLWAPLGWVYYEWFLVLLLAALIAQVGCRVRYGRSRRLRLADHWLIRPRHRHPPGRADPIDRFLGPPRTPGFVICSSTLRPPPEPTSAPAPRTARIPSPEPRIPTAADFRSYFFM